MFADQDDIAVPQRCAAHALFIHKRTVRAAEVLHGIGVAIADDAGVMARHRGVVDDDDVVGQSPDRRLRTQRTFFEYLIFKLQDEPRHDALH